MLTYLEDFEKPAGAKAATSTPSAEFTAGFAAGEAAAAQAASQQQDALSTELVQAISDSTFTFDEARLHLYRGLGPLFDALLTQLLPATLSQGLRDLLHDIVMTAAETDMAQPVTVSVHPDQIDAVSRALADLAHPHLRLAADPACPLHGAQVTAPKGETVLDIDQALDQIAALLHALPTYAERTS